jgi:hypothetical protein
MEGFLHIRIPPWARRLLTRGIAIVDDRQYHFVDAGAVPGLHDRGMQVALADRVRVRHRLVVDLLCALGVPTESAEADAEGIEHHVSEMTLKAFAQFLKSRG